MRLEEASEYVTDFFNNLSRTTHGDINVRTCEGNQIVAADVSYSVRKVVGEGRDKTSWIHTVPWVVARARTRAGAREAYSQLSRIQNTKHADDPMMRKQLALLPSIKIVADGGGVPDDLESEARELGNTPLDEGPGEGYHRRTHCTKKRAAVSRNPWLMGSTRFGQNLSLARRFCSYGEDGKNVFRYEWRNCKRLLQTNRAKRHRPLRISDYRFYRRLYRIQQSNDEDWASLVGKSEGAKDKEVNATDVQKLQSEYLRSAPLHKPYCM